LKSRPSTFCGLPLSAAAEKSMIANLLFGNFLAIVAVASPMRKPTDTVRSFCAWADVCRFGM
jgi:hypothetical protein